MDKAEVSGILQHIGVLLELKGENPFKSRAYTNAARILEMLDEDLEQLVREKRLASLKGIGKALAEKVEVLVTTGRLPYYEELKSELPSSLFDLLSIQGLGAKKVSVLYQVLGISTLDELTQACMENRLVDLPGFGKKTQENILKGIRQVKQNTGRYLIHEAGEIALRLLQSLQGCPGIQEMDVAGSLRRRKEIIKDIDILVSSVVPQEVMQYIVSLSQVDEIVAQGETKVSVLLKEGIAVDIRVVSPEQYPYALHHFTGSKEHNTRMRQLAKTMNIKMNEYGLFKEEEEILVPCSNEVEIFKTLGLTFIPPEIRENMGEIEAAMEGKLPQLVESKDIKGIIHVHSIYSDGISTIQALAEEARRQGYQYMGLTDHSQSAFYANGLKEEEIERQCREINRINDTMEDFHILKGIESDILANGDLDYPLSILENLDFVIASVHSLFRMNKADMTKRILAALDNPATTILGHPTGRLLLSREGYEVDMEQILKKAAANGVAIEINANPHRLDLDWRWCMRAKEMGVRLVIGPDAHDVAEIANISFGIAIARKGWLEKKDVLNCLSLSALKKYLTPKR